MTSAIDVLDYLLPQGGWYIAGDTFDDIEWLDESRPKVTKAQFEAGFAQYDAWKANQEADAIAAKETAQAKLAALGLTSGDLEALGL
jgi:hypothetical protein